MPRAWRTSVRWPSCSAPIVGTSAIRAPASRQPWRRPRRSATVRAISIPDMPSTRRPLASRRLALRRLGTEAVFERREAPRPHLLGVGLAGLGDLPPQLGVTLDE